MCMHAGDHPSWPLAVKMLGTGNAFDVRSHVFPGRSCSRRLAAMREHGFNFTSSETVQHSCANQKLCCVAP